MQKMNVPKMNRKKFVRLGVVGVVGAGGIALTPRAAPAPVLASPAAGQNRDRSKKLSPQERIERIEKRLEKTGERLGNIVNAHSQMVQNGQSVSSSDLIGSLRSLKSEANNLSTKVDTLIAKLQ